ncbi:hypothetical protein Tco_0574625, partial [Tanacetum coccineum]
MLNGSVAWLCWLHLTLHPFGLTDSAFGYLLSVSCCLSAAAAVCQLLLLSVSCCCLSAAAVC